MEIGNYWHSRRPIVVAIAEDANADVCRFVFQSGVDLLLARSPATSAMFKGTSALDHLPTADPPVVGMEVGYSGAPVQGEHGQPIPDIRLLSWEMYADDPISCVTSISVDSAHSESLLALPLTASAYDPPNEQQRLLQHLEVVSSVFPILVSTLHVPVLRKLAEIEQIRGVFFSVHSDSSAGISDRGWSVSPEQVPRVCANIRACFKVDTHPPVFHRVLQVRWRPTSLDGSTSPGSVSTDLHEWAKTRDIEMLGCRWAAKDGVARAFMASTKNSGLLPALARNLHKLNLPELKLGWGRPPI